MSTYRDWTREYVVYNRQGEIPAWLQQTHRDHLNQLNRLARKMGVFIRVDFFSGDKWAISVIDIKTPDGHGVSIPLSGMVFYGRVTLVSQMVIGMLRHPHLAALYELYKKGCHHDDIQALL